MIRRAKRHILLMIAAAAILAGCAAAPDAPRPADSDAVSRLATGVAALGPAVAPGEAGRLAEIAYAETARLARAYEITDPPLIHNMKVNMGLRPRGLCYHWADDLEARLRREGFETLSFHRAIANADNPFRIEHSTVIVSARGDDMFAGIVLDPWRKGGELHWTPTVSDADYRWQPRQVVFDRKRARQSRVAVARARAE